MGRDAGPAARSGRPAGVRLGDHRARRPHREPVHALRDVGRLALDLVEPALAASAAAFDGVDPAGTVPTPPHGDLPAPTAAGAAALDAAVHAWDVAVAIGRKAPFDDALAAELLVVAREIVEPLRQYGAYAPALPAQEGTRRPTPCCATSDATRSGLPPRLTRSRPETAPVGHGSSTDAPAIRPFRVEVPQAELDDVHDRLRRTRFTDEIPGTDGEYGTSVASVRALVRYWLEAFDWRALEDRLNAFPQFVTEIDGQDVHFLHVRSGRRTPSAWS
ncbi:epoxide hydrolase N-terminal domain-containing protein [Oerskovia sp. M15]